MSEIKIYHNPRCSKSRQALALIQEAGHTPEIILYLDRHLTVSDISELSNKLGFESVRQLMRTGEAVYKELGLKSVTDEKRLLEAMTANPKLIERPIVVRGGTAVLGRPPEAVNRLL